MPNYPCGKCGCYLCVCSKEIDPVLRVGAQIAAIERDNVRLTNTIIEMRKEATILHNNSILLQMKLEMVVSWVGSLEYYSEAGHDGAYIVTQDKIAELGTILPKGDNNG